jgi:hypothetical protein
MSTVARRFSASPTRLSSATWKAIVELICKNDAGAAAEFAKVSAVASCLINDKLFAKNPLVVKSKGPRLRIYCLYGEDSIEGEDINEDALSWQPTADEWHAFLPCSQEEYRETAASLKAKSAKFSAYNIETGIPNDEAGQSEKFAARTATVDWEAFRNL